MVHGVKTWIARQVRALREQRGWSQEDLGDQTGKPQSAISRVEDPDYGKLTLQTLFDLARAYDLPLLIQFVEWSDWLCRMDDSSTEALQKESFNADALRDLGSGQVLVDPMYQGTTSFFEPSSTLEWGMIYSGTNLNHKASSGITGTIFDAPNFAGTSLNTAVTAAPTIRQYGAGVFYSYGHFDDPILEDEDDEKEFDPNNLMHRAILHGRLLREADNG